MAKLFSYNKQERLKSRKQLEKVFETGKSFTVFPVKLFYVFTEDQDNFIKTGVGVSSRYFKKAVQRNRIKRLLREAYRTEKQSLHIYLNNTKKKLAVFLLYIDREMPRYKELTEKMKLCIQRLVQELQ